MKISTRGRYALRMMLDLARRGGADTPISLASVAERTGISHGYLEQVALSLRNAGLVRGVAGRHGGYKLSSSPEDISIRQIIEATIGPICVVDCIEEPESCPRAESCECRVVYAMINLRVGEVLEEYNLADLIDPGWMKETGRSVTGRLVGLETG
ncbi:MAG: Rrf2 family transcriptional regulator [Acidobacteria bacterium]|jgi:Rrf2 family cysteine metabolism transcriptional repressor|nr:Rrf2 family transcriptional regulator [Acidobacteriota bacterium]